MRVLILVAHDPHADPRPHWMARHAPAGLEMGVLGIGAPIHFPTPRNAWRVAAASPVRFEHKAPAWTRAFAAAGAVAAVTSLKWIAAVLHSTQQDFADAVGAPGFDARAQALAYHFQSILETTTSLLAALRSQPLPEAIIAADLLTLPAALLHADGKIPVIYDAHEYWPEADLGSAPFETSWWRDFERQMVAHTAMRVTVSPGLAALMTAQYGRSFDVLPNAEPKDAAGGSGPRTATGGDRCRFLFQGGFAQGRGLESLIRAWPGTSEKAILQLRGPAGPYKDKLVHLASGTGLLGSRIEFLQSVAPPELVHAATQAQVGLLPYEPVGMNHIHCCPNKLSQYMAAGLPLLANQTTFVGDVVRAAGAGLVVDFGDPAALATAVDELVREGRRGEMARASRHYFEQHFHWESVSGQFYAELLQVLQTWTADAQARRIAAPGPEAQYLGFVPKGGQATSLAASPLPLRVARRIAAFLPYRVREVVKGAARLIGLMASRG